MSYEITTKTSTYTVVDVRKAFEGFAADLGMIASRTKKWDTEMVAEVVHDIRLLAENYYLDKVDIQLLDSADDVLRASSYSVNENGSSATGDRAGGNDWPCLDNTRLGIIIDLAAKWKSLSDADKQAMQSRLKRTWFPSSVDVTYSHLQRQDAQQYASNGYELNKQNFK